jgi:hypothetical protein
MKKKIKFATQFLLEIVMPDSTTFHLVISEMLFAGGQARPQYREFILLSSYIEH